MTKTVPTVAVSDLQRSTKKVLDTMGPYALIQSHGRNRGLLVAPELADRLLASGLLEGLLEIPTRDGEEQRAEKFSPEALPVPTSDTTPLTAPAADLSALARLIAPVLTALSHR